MFRSHRDITRYSFKDSDKNKDNSGYYNCNYCEDEYCSETEVEIHKRIKHKDLITSLVSDPTKVICKICFQECDTQEQFLRHLKMEHLLSSEHSFRVERKIFICDVCNQIFFNKDMLTVHIVHNHKENMNKTMRVKCPKCSKMLRLPTVWYHFQLHEIQSVACCPICLKKCNNRIDLRNHLKSHLSHFYCDICGYEGKRSETFKEHIVTFHNRTQSAHGGIQDNVVKRCFIPTKFTFFKIQSHWGIWKGIKLQDGIHLCILCREIVVTSDGNLDKLKEHVHNAHTVNKQDDKKVAYVCTCGEAFFNKILLKHHIFKLKGDHKAVDDNIPHQPPVSAHDNTKVEIEMLTKNL